MTPIESLLSARMFAAPQVVGERVYFISNLSGRLSLYVMDLGGSVPEPLLPPNIALQNPELVDGYSFVVFPHHNRILIMLDSDGDEQYQPVTIPLEGGYPQPAFSGNDFVGGRLSCAHYDLEQATVYFSAQMDEQQTMMAFRGDLVNDQVTKLGENPWGLDIAGVSPNHQAVVLASGYTAGDTVLWLWEAERPALRTFVGIPLEERASRDEVHPTGHGRGVFTADGFLFLTAVFEDSYGLAYRAIAGEQEVYQVHVAGLQHTGTGELERIEEAGPGRYTLQYNIDGASWIYEGHYDAETRTLHIDYVICGTGILANGVTLHANYAEAEDTYAFSFSSATAPTQLYTVSGPMRERVQQHTRERVLAIPQHLLAPGEDASFVSHDGLRISARLYLPAEERGFPGKRPLVYYIHGGPQSQERPDFAWFSMPLIQFLTLNGFAVFVPNVRGSSGYGLSYMKHVDRDWGGQDRLDHVHAMGILSEHPRVDTSRAAVVGRSYGGYMTLTMATRHPTLWKAAVDMFGPYDLLTFLDRIPETWKTYFSVALGDPVRDRDFLVERSPKTYIDQITCPLLVIQGQNDPRVIEQESRDVVERLQAAGKPVDYILFADEGHDVLKFDNRVRCYTGITDFFKKHLLDD